MAGIPQFKKELQELLLLARFKEVKEMCGSREAESGTSEGFVKALAIFLTLTPAATT